MMQRVLVTKAIASPVGGITLVASDRGLCAVMFESGKHPMRYDAPQQEDAHPLLLRAEKQLAEYFEGKRKTFDIRLDMQGSIFQLKAWQQLQKIPYGQTISYGEQAKRMGDANKARAVGAANGRNPLSIIVPCHRVVGNSGALTGYAGSLPVKEFLLNLEASH